MKHWISFGIAGTCSEIYFEDFKEEAFDLIATFYANTDINPDDIGGGFEMRKNYYRDLEISRYYSPEGLIFSSEKAQELSDELFQNSILNYEGTFMPDTIAPIISSVTDWERKLLTVIEAGDIPFNDQKALWIQSSIMRHSAFYWASDNANPDGIIHGSSQNLDRIEDFPFDGEGDPLEPPAIRPFLGKLIWGVIIGCAMDAYSGSAGVSVMALVCTLLHDVNLKQK